MRKSQSSSVAGRWYPVSSCTFEQLLWGDAGDALAGMQGRPRPPLLLKHLALWLTNFDEAMHADRLQASLGLHALVEFVEALAIAVHIEIGDGPGHCFQVVDHCANIAISARPPAFKLLNREKTSLIKGRIDVPPVLREAPLCRCPLQEIDEFRTVLAGSRLRGQERSPALEDTIDLPGAEGNRTDQHEVEGGIGEGEASLWPAVLRLRPRESWHPASVQMTFTPRGANRLEATAALGG